MKWVVEQVIISTKTGVLRTLCSAPMDGPVRLALPRARLYPIGQGLNEPLVVAEKLVSNTVSHAGSIQSVRPSLQAVSGRRLARGSSNHVG